MLSEFEAELKNNDTNYDSFIASLKKLNKNYEKTCEKITTISKYRIIKPLNQFDPIRTLKVSNEVMDKIDKAIIDLFTK